MQQSTPPISRRRKGTSGAILSSPKTTEVPVTQPTEDVKKEFKTAKPSCFRSCTKIFGRILLGLSIFSVIAFFYLVAVSHRLITYRIDGVGTEVIEYVWKCGPRQAFWSDFGIDNGPFKPYLGRSQDEILEKGKQEYMNDQRERYQYAEPEEFLGFPPSIKSFDDVYCDQYFPLPDALQFWANLRFAQLNGIFTAIMSKLRGWNDFGAFNYIFKSPFFPAKPDRLHHWESDEFFSKMRLSGVNPVLLNKIDKIPANFNIDRTRLAKSLENGATLESGLTAGRFYLEDYTIMEGVCVSKKGDTIFAGLALHYVDYRGVLVPVAIQLNLEGDNTNLGTYYPDDGDAWLFAKIATQLSYALHHQVVTHLLKTHLFIEVWTIAMHRNFLPDHPLYIMLESHLQRTMAINYEAREILLPVIIDEITSIGVVGSRLLADRVYRSYNFTQGNLKTDLKNRGVWNPEDDKQALPGYDYRDFGLQIYDAMEHYSQGIVDAFYIDDAAVMSDAALFAFAKDVNQGGKMIGFPSPIKTKEDLVNVVTMIMFTCSAQHASVNYIQYEYLSYIPSAPLSLKLSQKFPATKAEITREWIFSILPTMQDTVEQTTTVWALSSPPIYDGEMLDAPVNWNFAPAQQVTDQFVANLKLITENMHKMNADRSTMNQYTVLYPNNIPKATSI